MKRTMPLGLVVVTLIYVNVNYVAKAEDSRQQQEEVTIGELKVSMDTQFKQIHKDLGEVKGRLIKLDDDIRSNEKVGINTRLERLENIKNWVVWIIPLTIIPLMIAFLIVFFVHYFSTLKTKKQDSLVN